MQNILSIGEEIQYYPINPPVAPWEVRGAHIVDIEFQSESQFGILLSNGTKIDNSSHHLKKGWSLEHPVQMLHWKTLGSFSLVSKRNESNKTSLTIGDRVSYYPRKRYLQVDLIQTSIIQDIQVYENNRHVICLRNEDIISKNSHVIKKVYGIQNHWRKIETFEFVSSYPGTKYIIGKFVLVQRFTILYSFQNCLKSYFFFKQLFDNRNVWGLPKHTAGRA